MMDIYNNAIVADACQGNNLLGNWWQVRVSHAVPRGCCQWHCSRILVVLILQGVQGLFNPYFQLVGAALLLDGILKIVSLHSVTRHLAMLLIASTAAWIYKSTNSTMSFLATDVTTSVVGPVVTILLVIPWTILGWVCVRRECKWRFLLLSVLSIVRLTILPPDSGVDLTVSSLRLGHFSQPSLCPLTSSGLLPHSRHKVPLQLWSRICHIYITSPASCWKTWISGLSSSPKGPIQRPELNQHPRVCLLEIPPMPSDPSGPPAPRNGTFMRASVYSHYNVATVKILITTTPLGNATLSLSPTPSVTSVTQRLRKVFEYRKAQEPKSTPPSPGVQIQTSSLVQPDEVPVPPLPKPAEDEIITVKRKNEKSKRRSRSVSFGRTSSIWTRDAMQTITESDVWKFLLRKFLNGRGEADRYLSDPCPDHPRLLPHLVLVVVRRRSQGEAE
uniref:SCIV192 protein n=1 Tax=Amanita muscaria TaxID=41956 RepID=Q9C197_AMAMU|nr:SCIV192 protein [Amanita muscaria]